MSPIVVNKITSSELQQLALDLLNIGCFKFGQFTLKSGLLTPIYIDLRLVISVPKLMNTVSRHLWQLAFNQDWKPQLLCGVPYTALPLATCISVEQNIPMLICRKDPKDYGTKKMVEGKWTPEQHCLIVEDVISTGASIGQTARSLRQEGVLVEHAVALVNRCHGGEVNLEKTFKIQAKSVYRLVDLVGYLFDEGRITADQVVEVHAFLHSFNEEGLVHQPTEPSLVAFCPDVNSRLNGLVLAKRSSLCIALDSVETASELLGLVEQVAPYVCAVKTHLDLLSGAGCESNNLGKRMRQLANKHGFLIVEDRKLGDIGQTVLGQLTGGVWHIAEWCDLVTVHALPGPGLFEALRRVPARQDGSLACLVVAEMSCKNSLTDDKYKSKCLELAKQFPDVVAGFVCQQAFSCIVQATAPSYWVPGIRLADENTSGDSLGQCYQSPERVLARFPIDETGAQSSAIFPPVVCIVGRGVTESDEVVAAAERYRVAIQAAKANSM